MWVLAKPFVIIIMIIIIIIIIKIVVIIISLSGQVESHHNLLQNTLIISPKAKKTLQQKYCQTHFITSPRPHAHGEKKSIFQ